MSLWLVRAGSRGEFEEKYLAENRVYLTWGELSHDLSQITSQAKLCDLMEQVYPNNAAKNNVNQGSHIWTFIHELKTGDWIVMPSILKPVIHFAKVTGNYQFDIKAEPHFCHYRQVEWFARDIPIKNIDQDFLSSLNEYMTIFKVNLDNADQIILNVVEKAQNLSTVPHDNSDSQQSDGVQDQCSMQDEEEEYLIIPEDFECLVYEPALTDSFLIDLGTFILQELMDDENTFQEDK